jgi:hypothetical protein
VKAWEYHPFSQPQPQQQGTWMACSSSRVEPIGSYVPQKIVPLLFPRGNHFLRHNTPSVGLPGRRGIAHGSTNVRRDRGHVHRSCVPPTSPLYVI